MRYPLNRDLSHGKSYPPFKLLGPGSPVIIFVVKHGLNRLCLNKWLQVLIS